MLGAIIGDIVGSPWEFNRIKTKSFPLFSEKNGFTDDTIMTIAVADALLHKKNPTETMREWFRKVKPCRGVGGYGKKFFFWLAAPTVQPPYNSYGNGAAMRISPAAYLSKSLDQALEVAKNISELTHNHPEGLKGALATTHAIYLARQGETCQAIRSAIATNYQYDMLRHVEQIRPNYKHTEAAQGSVPEALISALDATDYEDAVRNAVSLGGDADTMSAIAGSLAEALFGIPEDIKTKGLEYLTEEMKSVINVSV